MPSTHNPGTQLQTAQAKLQTLNNIAGMQKQRYIADVLDARPQVMYSPGDYKAIRSLIYDNVASAISSRFPLYNQRVILDVKDLKYEGPQDFTVQQQKDAIMQNKSLGRKLRGRWVLSDARTNKKIAQTGHVTLMSVPYITDRGTFIRGGSQYTFNNIMRLQPGVYTKKNNEDQVTAQFNIKRGTGAGFGMRFTPSTGIFYINKGTRNAPAYTVLRDMGVTDEQLQRSWGKQLFEINRQAGTGQRALSASQRLYSS